MILAAKAALCPQAGNKRHPIWRALPTGPLVVGRERRVYKGGGERGDVCPLRELRLKDGTTLRARLGQGTSTKGKLRTLVTCVVATDMITRDTTGGSLLVAELGSVAKSALLCCKKRGAEALAHLTELFCKMSRWPVRQGGCACPRVPALVQEGPALGCSAAFKRGGALRAPRALCVQSTERRWTFSSGVEHNFVDTGSCARQQLFRF